jgi:hypothetical protein
MLYCPKCGSANRRGSRFCNECGEMLPMHTGLRCPMCGTMNPVQNAYCDQCNARIVPMTAPSEKEPGREQPPIRGLSLPTISLDEQPPPVAPQKQDTEEGTGDWLAQLRDSTDEDEMETLATEGEEEGTEDWLGQLRESTEEVEEGADWLAQLRDSAGTEEDVPSAEPEAAAEPVEPTEIPDWLRDMGPVGVEQPPAEAEAAAVTGVEPADQRPVTEEAVSEMPTPAEVPDWLQDLAPAEPVPSVAEEATAPAAETAAIAGVEPAGQRPVIEETAPEIPTPTGVPDWLQDLAPAEPVPSVAEEAAAPKGAEEAALEIPAPAEVPDWLQDLAPTEPVPSVAEEAAAPKGAEEAAPEIPAPAEVPDWLQDLAPTEPVPSVAEEAAAPKGAEEAALEIPAPAEVPDWLQDAAPAEAAAPAVAGVEPADQRPVTEKAAPETSTPAEMPDWLQDLALAEEAPAPAVAGVEPADQRPVTEEAAPEIPAPAEMPDWLQDLAPAEEAPAPAVTGVEPADQRPVTEEAAPEIPAPAEMPDWLKNMAPAEAVAPTATDASALADVEPTAEMPSPAEVPDWLQQAAPPSMPPPTPPFIGEPAIAEAEAPEWLTDLKQEAPSVPEGVTLPFPSEPDTAAAEAAGLARAEIPAWLEAMRPTAAVSEEVVEEEPAETEGLLEGLRGVLTPLPMIDVTHTRESTLSAEINQAAMARAQLLQSLLTRPTEAPQPKSRKRTTSISELIPRILITVALFVVVGGLLLISQDPALDSQIPTLAQPDTASIAGMYTLIEGVTEGETVLVAFEYGPTNADELNPVTRAILEHLIERKANIFIASTQPEGLAVAEVLRSDINSQEQVESGQQPKFEYAKESPGYRPGDATGVSQILASTGTRPTMIIVLVAQPESLRWWIEQTRAHYGDASPPMAAGVSTALEIVASPYLDANANQLEGIVSGLGGAVAYETQRGTAGQPSRRLDALAVGHLVIVISTLAGAALYIAGGSHRREK